MVTSGGTNAWTLGFGTASSITDNGGGYSLTMNGTGGTLILSGSNTYSGGTSVNAGVLTFLNRTAQPASGMTNVAAGATLGLGVGLSANLYGSLDLDAVFAGTMPNVSSDPNSNVGIDTTAGNFTYASNIPYTTMGLTKLGFNTLTLTGASNYTGPTTVSGGTLQLGDGTGSDDASLNTSGIVNNAAVVYNVFGSQTANYPISGPGTLTKAGPGTLTLSASGYMYTGNTFLTSGTLAMNTGVPSSSVVMSSNTTLDLSGASGGTVALGSLADAAGSPTGHQVFLGGNMLQTGLDNTNTTFSGAISDGGSLMKSGTGTFTLAGANTYSGGTTVNQGVLTFLNRTAQPPSGMTNVAAGATLGLGVGTSANLYGAVDVDSLFAGTNSLVNSDPNSNVGIDTTAGDFTYASNIPAATMGLTKLGANTLTLTGSNNYTGLTTVSSGTLQLGDGTSGHDGIALTGNIVNNAALVYNLNGNQTYSGQINGAGSVTKTGPGTLTLTSFSSYAGPTIIIGGTLKLQSASGANASLVGFWSGNGNANDSTGNNPGTLVNGVSFAPGRNGQQAFSFNGTSYVQAGTQGLPTGNQNRTIDLWFNETSPIADESFLAGYGSAFGSYNEAYEIFTRNYYSKPGQVSFSQWGGGISGPTIQDGQWYNLAVTNSGDLATLYLNGNEVASGSATIDTPSNAPFYIGTIGNATGTIRKMNGLIQDVAIYNTALSQSEIQAIMGTETPNLLPTTTAVTIAANATLDLNGVSQQVASLADYAPGKGGSIINSNTSASVLTLSPTGGSTTFSGMIQGGGTLGTISLVMSGSGTQVLAGSLLGPGSLTVNAGTTDPQRQRHLHRRHDRQRRHAGRDFQRRPARRDELDRRRGRHLRLRSVGNRRINSLGSFLANRSAGAIGACAVRRRDARDEHAALAAETEDSRVATRRTVKWHVPNRGLRPNGYHHDVATYNSLSHNAGKHLTTTQRRPHIAKVGSGGPGSRRLATSLTRVDNHYTK